MAQTYYNAAAEKARQARDTPERILQIAKTKGFFSVTMRYRDDWLRRRCKSLTEKGLLKCLGRQGHLIMYVPVMEESNRARRRKKKAQKSSTSNQEEVECSTLTTPCGQQPPATV